MAMSDPIQSAYAEFEAARLIHDAKYEYAHQVFEEISALPVEPRSWGINSTRAEVVQWTWWQSQRRRRTEARLGTAEDEYIVPYRDRMESAEKDLRAIEATSHDDLLCQLRAWWCVDGCIVDEDSSEGRMILRLLKDLERLAAPPPPAEVVQFPAR